MNRRKQPPMGPSVNVLPAKGLVLRGLGVLDVDFRVYIVRYPLEFNCNIWISG